MDPARAPGYIDCRAAALTGVCLPRTVELDNVRIEVCDWPGVGRALVYVPDPASGPDLVSRLAAAFQPAFRLLSVSPRTDQPYQVHVADLQGVCRQFGLLDVVVVAQGLSCASALLLAAWYPETARAIVLIGQRSPGTDDDLIARSLRDCPPDWARLRQRIRCRVLEVSDSGTNLVEELEALLA